MPVAMVCIDVDITRKRKRVTYSLAFSGAYPTGGDTIDPTVATDPNELGARIPSTVPKFIEINGAPGGNGAKAIKGATAATSKIKLWSSTNTELAAGAYNAAVSGDVDCTATFVYPVGKS